jgi:hypothetical protein
LLPCQWGQTGNRFKDFGVSVADESLSLNGSLLRKKIRFAERICGFQYPVILHIDSGGRNEIATKEGEVHIDMTELCIRGVGESMITWVSQL